MISTLILLTDTFAEIPFQNLSGVNLTDIKTFFMFNDMSVYSSVASKINTSFDIGSEFMFPLENSGSGLSILKNDNISSDLSSNLGRNSNGSTLIPGLMSDPSVTLLTLSSDSTPQLTHFWG